MPMHHSLDRADRVRPCCNAVLVFLYTQDKQSTGISIKSMHTWKSLLCPSVQALCKGVVYEDITFLQKELNNAGAFFLCVLWSCAVLQQTQALLQHLLSFPGSEKCIVISF